MTGIKTLTIEGLPTCIENGYIATDSNGTYCLICEGVDQDGEGLSHNDDCIVSRLERAESALKRVISALEFYANEDNMDIYGSYIIQSDAGNTFARDWGKTARAAIDAALGEQK